MQTQEYAIYSGDDFVTCGTASQIAKELGVRKGTVYFWATVTEYVYEFIDEEVAPKDKTIILG